MTTQVDTSTITLTESAALAISDLITERDLAGYGLRVFVSGGGCSGFQYGMSLDNTQIENDTIIEQYGVKLLIDDVSIQYLKGASIDFVSGEQGTGFKIDNPNPMPASSCGCGSGEAKAEGSCACGGGGGGGGCGCGC
jgi:iron-sulfur cluster assembly protein